MTNEGYAGNPLHFFLFVFASVVIFFFSVGKTEFLKKYTFCIYFGFLIFCFLLKWQPWHSRLHTPLFALASVSIALGLAPFVEKRWKLAVAGLFVSSLPWLFLNQTRSLITIVPKGFYSILEVPRLAQYFIERPGLFEPYMNVIDEIRKSNCKSVGIKLIDDGWEYPLWVIAKFKGVDVSFTHIDTPPDFAMLENKASDDICAYIAIEQQDSWRPTKGSLKSMKLMWASKPVRLYTH
jgi:hypothetical protein